MTSSEYVQTRLALAGCALKSSIPKEKIKRSTTWWPDIVYKRAEAYGWESATFSRSPATPEEISALDEVLEWLWKLTHDERQVVIARITGMSWRRIMKHREKRGQKGSHETCRQVYRRAVESIAAGLSVVVIVTA